MAITITGGLHEEALDYNHIHMVTLIINQEMTGSVDVVAPYNVDIVYKIYAIDSKGKKHYGPLLRTIKLPDYMKTALEKASKGDMDLIESVISIEKAMAKIIEDQDPDVSAAVVE